MAIKITLNKTERVLFCASKWWGDPDMPEGLPYPTVEVNEDGEVYDYPLTFVCQINCEDIAPFDKENFLPHEGMLYFFAALDAYLGYDSPTQNGKGEWPKGHFVVKYAKSINFETFQTCMMVDDEDQALTEPELEIVFSECDEMDRGIKILGKPALSEVAENYPDSFNIIQLDNDETAGIILGEGGLLNLLIKDSDLKFQNWKRAKAYLHQ